MPETAVTVSGL